MSLFVRQNKLVSLPLIYTSSQLMIKERHFFHQNKLECLSLTSIFNLVSYLQVKMGDPAEAENAYQVQTL